MLMNVGFCSFTMQERLNLLSFILKLPQFYCYLVTWILPKGKLLSVLKLHKQTLSNLSNPLTNKDDYNYVNKIINIFTKDSFLCSINVITTNESRN